MGKDSKTLTSRQKRFTEEYVKDLNATKAAERSGFSKKNSAHIGHETLRRPQVREEIQKKMDERSERTKIDADYVLYTIKDTIERCRQAEPVMEWDPIAKEMVHTGEYKFDATNVLKGADLLGKHLKLWNEAPKVDINLNLTALSDEELDKKIKEYQSHLK